jgi:hypothetical protein
MSMICTLLGLTPPQVAALRATPALATDVAMVAGAGGFDVADMLKRMPAERRAAFQAQMAAAEAEVAPARKAIGALGPLEPTLDLQKSWHILHYLFTGHVDASNAPGDGLMTGESLGEDVGYGPPRLHDAAAVRGFAGFLQAQAVERLQARVNFAEMNRLGVYGLPGGGGMSEAEFADDVRGEVTAYFPPLRDYVGRMAAKGNGLLIWLS